jgi:hypothetical protein
MFKTLFLQLKTKNNVLYICFLPSKNHGFALGHLQAKLLCCKHVAKDVYKYLRGAFLNESGLWNPLEKTYQVSTHEVKVDKSIVYYSIIIVYDQKH